MFDRVVIIGVGLIGGSLGLALRRRSLARRVIGVDKNPENLRLAMESGAVHETTCDPAGAVRGSELVVIATPVGETTSVLKQLRNYLSFGAVVTDVGSTKVEVCTRAAEMMPPGTWFVGGHPMAGSEYSGMAGADPYLFENAFYIITPFPDTPARAVERVKLLAAGVGARVVRMTPEQHDRAVAAVSHVPHLVAAALVNTLVEMPGGEDFLPLGAGGFRDTTRVAAGNPLMWRDIFLSNRGAVIEVLACFRQELERLERAISDRREEEILTLLEQASRVRKKIPARMRGYLGSMFEIVVGIPDRPGMIAGIAGLLGEAGINISDIEILRVREGEGGSIRLAFATAAGQEEAVRILRQAGYQVVKR
ncbi:MAG: prephenate dehydrogenase [Thermoanaerobacter sp.]|nr:prephenate dehydrogenase [Thermoanaerobacter sp.]